jgi:hypothetical protein
MQSASRHFTFFDFVFLFVNGIKQNEAWPAKARSERYAVSCEWMETFAVTA